MTEPTKHRHAKPKRAARPSRGARAAAEPSAGTQAPQDHASAIRDAVSGSGARTSRAGLPAALAWFRTVPGLVVVGVVVLGVAVLVGLVVSGGDDDSPSSASVDPRAPGASNASYGNRWTSPDGFKYQISVATLNDLVAIGSPSTCVKTPVSPDTTNLHFTVTIKNRSTSDAPVPEVLFGTNLSPDGSVRTSLRSFAKTNKDLEVTPLAMARTCADGARLGPQDRAKIPAGQSVSFTGTFGPTPLPVARGIVVVARYFAEDGSRSKPVDLVARFGDLPDP